MTAFVRCVHVDDLVVLETLSPKYLPAGASDSPRLQPASDVSLLREDAARLPGAQGRQAATSETPGARCLLAVCLLP